MAEIENLKIGNGGTLHIVGNEDIVANAWQAGKTYVKNKSYVIREHRLYVCNVTHTSVEPFDATKWTEITIGDAIGNNIGDLSTLTTSDKSSLVGAVNEVNAKESYKVRVSQLALPNTITLTANTATQVLNNTDIRTLGYSALDDIRNMTGTLVAAGFMWCSGGGALCPDTLVSDGKITMYLLSTYTKDITAIRLWTIWRE